LRRVIPILLVLVVLVPSVAHASALYRCAMDGETRTSCCCPKKAKHHETSDSNTELRASCCCKVTQLKAAESSVRAAPPMSLDMAPAVVPVAITISSIEAPVRIARVELPGSPRGPPEPLFVRHCSLLL